MWKLLLLCGLVTGITFTFEEGTFEINSSGWGETTVNMTVNGLGSIMVHSEMVSTVITPDTEFRLSRNEAQKLNHAIVPLLTYPDLDFRCDEVYADTMNNDVIDHYRIRALLRILVNVIDEI